LLKVWKNTFARIYHILLLRLKGPQIILFLAPENLGTALMRSGVARLWRTVPTPGARIAKVRKIMQKSNLYPTIKSKFFLYTLLKCVDVVYLNTLRVNFNNEIMKIAQGHLNKEFHMKK
jgi:hypothetical protein